MTSTSADKQIQYKMSHFFAITLHLEKKYFQGAVVTRVEHQKFVLGTVSVSNTIIARAIEVIIFYYNILGPGFTNYP